MTNLELRLKVGEELVATPGVRLQATGGTPLTTTLGDLLAPPEEPPPDEPLLGPPVPILGDPDDLHPILGDPGDLRPLAMVGACPCCQAGNPESYTPTETPAYEFVGASKWESCATESGYYKPLEHRLNHPPVRVNVLPTGPYVEIDGWGLLHHQDPDDAGAYHDRVILADYSGQVVVVRLRLEEYPGTDRERLKAAAADVWNLNWGSTYRNALIHSIRLTIPFRETPYVIDQEGQSFLYARHLAIHGLPEPTTGNRPVLEFTGSLSDGPLLDFIHCSHVEIRNLILDGRALERGPLMVAIPDGNGAPTTAMKPVVGPYIPEMTLESYVDGNGNTRKYPIPAVGSADNLRFQSCDNVLIERVTSRNTPGYGFSIHKVSKGPGDYVEEFKRLDDAIRDWVLSQRATRSWAPHNFVLKNCFAMCCGAGGLLVSCVHSLRVHGGAYSYSNGFWTMAGIQIEAWTQLWDLPWAPWTAICDVLIRGTEFHGNWKGVQINRRWGTRGITVVECRFSGATGVPADGAACAPYVCPSSAPGSGPACGIPENTYAYWAYGIVSNASWVFIRDNIFNNYSTADRPIQAIIRVGKDTSGVVVVDGNRFGFIDNSTEWDGVRMIPILIEKLTASATVRNNVLFAATGAVSGCFIRCDAPNPTVVIGNYVDFGTSTGASGPRTYCPL